MHRIALHRRRRVAAVLGGLVALGAVAVSGGQGPAPVSALDNGPDVGIVCSDGPTFDMTTDADYINLPDGNTVYMYGYKLVGTPFQHPSPVLCVNEGDTVTITLTNTLPRDISMVFPGQHDVLANGAPATPQFSIRGQPGDTDVAHPGRDRRRWHRDLQLRRRPSWHVPLRIRHRPRRPGTHGPVRRPDRSSGDGPRLRLQPGHRPVHRRSDSPSRRGRTTPRSSWCCCRRSIRT